MTVTMNKQCACGAPIIGARQRVYCDTCLDERKRQHDRELYWRRQGFTEPPAPGARPYIRQTVAPAHPWRGPGPSRCPECVRLAGERSAALLVDDIAAFHRLSHEAYVHQEQAHGIPLKVEVEQLELWEGA